MTVFLEYIIGNLEQGLNFRIRKFYPTDNAQKDSTEHNSHVLLCRNNKVSI